MKCPAYSLQRSKLLDKITQKFPKFSLLDESQKFVWILSQDDSEAIHWVSNFIFSAMKKTQKKSRIIAHHKSEKVTGLACSSFMFLLYLIVYMKIKLLIASR